MKISASLFALTLPFVAAVSADETKRPVLFHEAFNQPNGITAILPPAEGLEFIRFIPNFQAWSGGGQISVTYGDGYGYDKSGGLYCAIETGADEGGYYILSTDPIKLPIVGPELLGASLNALTVDFALKLPAGKTLNLYIVPDGLAPELQASCFPNKVALAKIKGTGEYRKYSFKLQDAAPANVAQFKRFMQNALANGEGQASVNVSWHLDSLEWSKGEGYLIDNVEVSLDN